MINLTRLHIKLINLEPYQSIYKKIFEKQNKFCSIFFLCQKIKTWHIAHLAENDPITFLFIVSIVQLLWLLLEEVAVTYVLWMSCVKVMSQYWMLCHFHNFTKLAIWPLNTKSNCFVGIRNICDILKLK